MTMKISGFSFVRNGIGLYYPVAESIKSILPVVDEFIIAVGEGSQGDKTREEIAAIGDPKVKIIDTVWEEKYCKKGAINSVQTNIAKEACSGDWLFYLQADEVVHEKYLPVIEKRCRDLINNEDVEALIFRYKHFWGDYNHFQGGHGWYPHEIRIIRNRPDIHSWQSAQSFRRFDYFEHPRQPEGHYKLKAAEVDAEVFHYGWVRPPHLMQNKRKALDSVHWGGKKAKEYYKKAPDYFDYGPLDLLEKFEGTHPAVMEDMISRFDWGDKLQYSGKPDPGREKHKHETLRCRILSFIEKHFNGGKHIGEFKNYELLDV
ncbi:MAG: hypothetical protein ACLFQK_02400 [Fibrobacterota bacterium]